MKQLLCYYLGFLYLKLFMEDLCSKLKVSLDMMLFHPINESFWIILFSFHTGPWRQPKQLWLQDHTTIHIFSNTLLLVWCFTQFGIMKSWLIKHISTVINTEWQNPNCENNNKSKCCCMFRVPIAQETECKVYDQVMVSLLWSGQGLIWQKVWPANWP